MAVETRAVVAEGETGARRSLHRAVWMLAWPSVLTMLLQTLNSFTDRFFVGHLGPDALAAAGLGGQLMFLLFAVGMSIGTGSVALVARFVGGDETGRAATATRQSVWLGLLAAAACMGVMLPLRGDLVHLLGIDHRAAQLCIDYLGVTVLGVPFLFLMLILSSVFRGLGDTVTPLLVSIGVNIIHLGGDYLLIFGHGGFPRLGLVGGAWALMASQIVGAALYIWFLRRSPVAGAFSVTAPPAPQVWGEDALQQAHVSPLPQEQAQSTASSTQLPPPRLGGPGGRPSSYGLDTEWARRILKVSVPALWQNLSRILSMLAFTGVLARTAQATAGVAALTIGLTSESIAFMPGFAFAMAASTLTGQALGARDPRHAERSAWAALQQGFAIMCVMGTVFYVFARQFALLFLPDAQSPVLPLAVSYLQISALSEPFLAFGMILTGALNGAGDTRRPAWVSVVTMWGVRLPLAFLLARTLGFGTVGAWWAMAASTILGGVGALYLFKQGKWKRTVV